MRVIPVSLLIQTDMLNLQEDVRNLLKADFQVLRYDMLIDESSSNFPMTFKSKDWVIKISFRTANDRKIYSTLRSLAKLGVRCGEPCQYVYFSVFAVSRIGGHLSPEEVRPIPATVNIMESVTDVDETSET